MPSATTTANSSIRASSPSRLHSRQQRQSRHDGDRTGTTTKTRAQLTKSSTLEAPKAGLVDTSRKSEKITLTRREGGARNLQITSSATMNSGRDRDLISLDVEREGSWSFGDKRSMRAGRGSFRRVQSCMKSRSPEIRRDSTHKRVMSNKATERSRRSYLPSDDRSYSDDEVSGSFYGSMVQSSCSQNSGGVFRDALSRPEIMHQRDEKIPFDMDSSNNTHSNRQDSSYRHSDHHHVSKTSAYRSRAPNSKMSDSHRRNKSCYSSRGKYEDEYDDEMKSSTRNLSRNSPKADQLSASSSPQRKTSAPAGSLQIRKIGTVGRPTTQFARLSNPAQQPEPYKSAFPEGSFCLPFSQNSPSRCHSTLLPTSQPIARPTFQWSQSFGNNQSPWVGGGAVNARPQPVAPQVVLPSPWGSATMPYYHLAEPVRTVWPAPSYAAPSFAASQARNITAGGPRWITGAHIVRPLMNARIIGLSERQKIGLEEQKSTSGYQWVTEPNSPQPESPLAISQPMDYRSVLGKTAIKPEPSESSSMAFSRAKSAKVRPAKPRRGFCEWHVDKEAPEKLKSSSPRGQRDTAHLDLPTESQSTAPSAVTTARNLDDDVLSGSQRKDKHHNRKEVEGTSLLRRLSSQDASGEMRIKDGMRVGGRISEGDIINSENGYLNSVLSMAEELSIELKSKYSGISNRRPFMASSLRSRSNRKSGLTAAMCCSSTAHDF